MDTIIRGAAIYVVLLLIVRVSGRRTMAQMTPFDLVLLLVVAETGQQALLGDDYSITNSVLLIVTLFTIDIGLSYLKRGSRRIAQVIDGAPTVLMLDGVIDRRALRKSRMDEDDILVAARSQHGIDGLDKVRHAILEADSGISIVPR